jgi:hypothetical protein
MQILEALTVEGRTELNVLCYGVFAPAVLDEVFEALGRRRSGSASKIFKLFDEGWTNGLLLNETMVSGSTHVSLIISDAMSEMFAAGPCVAAICMYDGAFGTYDDIFSVDIASQTYAFAFSSDEPVVVMDSALVMSDEWRSVIALCRRRLG